MCSEKQESQSAFPELKPDDCPMLIMLSRMAAAAFLKLDFDGDEEMEMNRQQCYEILMDMYKGNPPCYIRSRMRRLLFNLR